MESEAELNAEILKITLTIKDHYPELSKYLEEMPVTIPGEYAAGVSRKSLSAYYESLKAMLGGYIAQKSRAQLEKTKNSPV